MSAPSKPDHSLGHDFDLEQLPDWLGTSINRLNDAILITEAEPFDEPGPKILWANPAFYRNTGYAPEEILGKNPRILQGPLTDRSMLDQVRAALEAWQSVRGEVLNYRKDGTTYWNEFEIVPVANKDGWYTHWVSVQRNVTERKLMELKLKELASTDFLTELLNRRAFISAMDDELSRLNRGIESAVGVLMLDLDLFKHVNDHHGHAAGDKVLHHVAELMRTTKRSVDIAGRIGGEEFAILMPGAEVDAVTTFAERLRERVMNDPTYFDNTPIAVTISIGIYILHDASVSPEAALAHADRALYQAKERGRNRVVVSAA